MLKLLVKADTWLDVIWRWGSAFSVAWFCLSWLAKKMSQFGTLNWADAIGLGFAGAMVFSVVVSLALIAIRYFRPVGGAAQATDDSSKATGIPRTPVPAYDDTGVKVQIAALDKKLEAVIAEASVSNGRFEELRDQLGYLAKPLIQRSQAEFLGTVEKLQMTPAVPKGMPPDENTLGKPDSNLQECMQRNWDRIAQDITNHGFDMSSLNSQIRTRESELAVNLPDDEFHWVSLHHKKNWYFWQARTELLNRWIDTQRLALSRAMSDLGSDAITSLSQLPNAR